MFIPSLLFNIHWHLGDKGQGTVGSIDLGFLGGSPLSFGENSQSLPLAFFFFCLIFSLLSFWDSNYTYVRPFDHVSRACCAVLFSVTFSVGKRSVFECV